MYFIRNNLLFNNFGFFIEWAGLLETLRTMWSVGGTVCLRLLYCLKRSCYVYVGQMTAGD